MHTMIALRLPAFLLPLALRFLRYSVSGISSFLLDLAILYALITVALLPYWVAVPLAFLTAVTVHYCLCRVWVFRGSPRSVGGGYVYFILILFGSLALIVLIVVGLVEFAHLNVYVARIIASLIAGLGSFYLNGRFNFRSFRLQHEYA